MATFIHKFGSKVEAELFLQGGIIGGSKLAGVGHPVGGKQFFLHALTLIFTGASTDTVTFAASPANAQVPMSIDEIITQIHTQTSNVVRARLLDGRLSLIAAGNPSSEVGLSASSTALTALGFEDGVAVSGTYYYPPDGAPPRWLNIAEAADGSNSIFVVVERP